MMQKKSVLAITSALLCGPVMAQENVTFYGLVDMSIARSSRILNAGRVSDQSSWRLDSGGFNGTRFGIRGVEDLGGGLAAFFTLESGSQADTGVLSQGGRFFGRQAFIGLSGPFGRISMGRQYTPWFIALSTSDPFGNNLLGNSGNIEQANSRLDNTIAYTSPDFNGFSFQGMYGLGENAGSTRPGSQVSAAFSYTRGPLWVTYGNFRQRNSIPATAAVPATSNLTGSGDLIGASYDFGPVKAFGNYARLRNVDAALTPAPSVRSGHRSAAWLVGLTAPVGAPGKVILSYISLDEKSPTNRDAKFWSLGYTHSLSKLTTLYTTYGRVVNDNGSALAVGSPSYPGIGESQFHAGISKRF